MGRSGGVAILVLGCGGPALVPDAVTDVPAAIDAVDAGPACDVSKPFGAPIRISGVNTPGADQWGWLMPDLLTIYYSSPAPGTEDREIYKATRSSPVLNFTGVTRVTSVSRTGYAETRPVLTDDGLTMLFVVSGIEIMAATRSTAADDFSAPFGVVDGTDFARDPWLSADGLTLYFASHATGNHELYRATRSSTAALFDAATPITEINTTANQHSPVLSRDGLELFFAQDSPTFQLPEIFHAVRATTSDPFGVPERVAELTSSGEDFPNWVSSDRCTLVFTRSVGATDWDIWIATRPL